MPSIFMLNIHAPSPALKCVPIVLNNLPPVAIVMAYRDKTVADLACTLGWVQKKHEYEQWQQLNYDRAERWKIVSMNTV